MNQCFQPYQLNQNYYKSSVSMKIQSCEQDKLTVYSFTFNRTHFATISCFNLENLKLFCLENQQRLGKIDIKFNINALRNVPTLPSTNYVLMTEYKQILTLPYLLRSCSPQMKIITTKSICNSAKIYVSEFYRTIKKINQVVNTMDFSEESQVYDRYQIEFNIDLGRWVDIFTKKEYEDCLARCICLNYGEHYKLETGNFVVGYPSGCDIGAAVWMIENCETKQNMLWVQGIAHHNWRACRQFQVNNMHNKIDHIIFLAGSLENVCSENKDELQCQSFLDMLYQRLTKSMNTKVILKNSLLICDIVNVIMYKFKEKFKKILITGLSATKMITYINSYVQFLNPNHRNRIYEDPPVNPFQAFEDLKEKMIYEGMSLSDISDHQHIPVKELLLRVTPYIHFQSDFHAYLEEGQGVTPETIMEPCINPQKLNNWLEYVTSKSKQTAKNIRCVVRKQEQISSFLASLPERLKGRVQVHGLGEDIQIVNEEQNNLHLIVEGDLSRIVSSFNKEGEWLSVTPYQPHLRLIEKSWGEKVVGELQKNGIEAEQFSRKGNGDERMILIKTERTVIKLEQFKISIKSNSEEELRVIDKAFEKVSKIIKLQ